MPSQCCDRFLREAPARLDATTQNAGVGAWRVQEHAIKFRLVLNGKVCAVRFDRGDDAMVHALHVLHNALKAFLRGIHGGDSTAAPHELREVACLPARRGAKIQHGLARLWREERRHRCARVVLHLEQTLLKAAKPRHLRVRRQANGAAARRKRCLDAVLAEHCQELFSGGAKQIRSGKERRRLIRDGAQLPRARCAVARQPPTQEPLGERLGRREPGRESRGRGQHRPPERTRPPGKELERFSRSAGVRSLREGHVPRDRSEHGVYEAGRAPVAGSAGQPHGLVHRSVVRDAFEEEYLIDPDSQDLAHGRVQLGDRLGGVCIENGIERSEPPDHAVAQFRGQAPVFGLQTGMRQTVVQ